VTAARSRPAAAASDHRSSHHARIRLERWGSNDAQQQSSTADHNAGTVNSFKNGLLTLALNDGSMVSGKITDATELKCEAAEPSTMPSHNEGDGSGSADNGDIQGSEDNGKCPG
jgi:hypothetical protein